MSTVFAIGGAEAKLRRRTVLEAFVAAAGGPDARIALVSSASSLGVEVVQIYTSVFTSLGAREVVSLRPESRRQARDPDLLDPLHKVSAIFLTGGNQLKLSSFITGTPFGDAIQEAYQEGVVVGGTSAGASILAEHMIAFGAGGLLPKQRIEPALRRSRPASRRRSWPHFEQRNRYGRLLSLVAQSPSLLGVGLDEDTAAVIHDGTQLEVIGRGAVTVVDGQHLISNAFAAKRTTPLLMSGAVIHILPAGSEFDLASRSLVAHQTAVPDSEVSEARAAEADLRDVMREVAAEDASPAY